MKFRIRDLFLITTLVALLFGTYQLDLVVFRQLLFLVLVVTGSYLGTKLPRVGGHAHGTCAIIALIFGGIYTLILVTFREQVFVGSSFSTRQVPTFAEWLFVGSCSTIIATALGGSLGPFLLSFSTKEPLPPAFRKDQKISASLMMAAILLIFFSMLDRISMGSFGRDWSGLIMSLVFIFMIFTGYWTWRLDTLREFRHRANGNGIPIHPLDTPDTSQPNGA